MKSTGQKGEGERKRAGSEGGTLSRESNRVLHLPTYICGAHNNPGFWNVVQFGPIESLLNALSLFADDLPALTLMSVKKKSKVNA
ncbi:hypothetical protein AFLA_004771 [Aspergillus flavus NRRL3357]|nr:hypothetical protein AFLA_004771 [Aspergillus flavus NRRL3357]